MSFIITYDESTFGITERSLKLLRNTLAKRIDHWIAVVEVPTDQICCGFLILDKDAEEAVFSGDGFRTDNGGEGGAGYKSAKALLQVFGIAPIHWPAVLNIWDGTSGPLMRKALRGFVDEVQRELKAEYYIKPADRTPSYLR